MYGQRSTRGRSRGQGRGQNSIRARGSSNGRGQRDRHQPGQRIADTFDNDEGSMNAHLSERLNARYQNNNGFRNGFHNNFEPTLDLNPHVSEYVHKQEAFGNPNDKDDWRSIPEIPSSSEICVEDGNTIALPPNKIDRPWTKTERYLRTHYRLLREDATAHLREAIDKFKKDPLRMDDNDMRIYEQVRVVGLTFNYKGIATRIRFSTVRSGRKILWSSSKRLTSGTLVALTPTNDIFRNRCMLAVVAARPLANLDANPPEIDIFLGDTHDHELDPQQTFIMIEATSGYFEAYRHTLKALQKQSKEIFPLSEHICKLEDNVGPPKYLLENPNRDLQPAADDNLRESFRHVDLLHNWPTAPSTALDKTQWEAMREILTRKLAIVQGPPGTGKTHVSKIAIEILLRNRSYEDPPIIVACQTNHALDQLLELVNEFEPLFVRLGGRSNSITVKARALFEIRKKEVIDDVRGSCFSKARREIGLETMRLKSLLSPIHEENRGSFSAEVLFKLGVINDQQLKSLEKGAQEWVRADNTTNEPMEMWLGRVVAPFNAIYTEDNFGFQEAEEDLELEQLRELEAESGIVDDEDTEMLKGDFFPLSLGLTTPMPTAETLDQAKRLLDTSRDLYRVPDHMKGPMYLVMQERAKAHIRYRLREAAKNYSKITKQIQIGHWERDAVYLQKAPIIGMTTTGLSKYRALVSSLKPKIILIEEAAEVLEAPVSVACVESLEHLILVGDHQQLQAHTSVRELEGEPYYLNISMFERLVRNQMPHKTLLRQRRMDPNFRTLIAPVYPGLEDHESVQNRSISPWGTGEERLWWFNHDLQELQDQQMSTYNDHEARMIAKFYRHFIRNSVPAAAITVLTFYNGQRKKILRELKDDPETASIYNKVKTVDSYQGEENHIVILSLVRSNNTGRIGFLDINNRVTVALSRAKFGFYIFGNGEFLAEHNELWDYVFNNMKRRGFVREALPLTCINHGNRVWVKHPEDFDKLNGGGCLMPCEGCLDCGHKCPMRCHPCPHARVLCHRVCGKELVCGHLCTKECRASCSCDCDEYHLYERIDNGANSVETVESAKSSAEAAWKSFTENQLTSENISKISKLHVNDEQHPLNSITAHTAQEMKPTDVRNNIQKPITTNVQQRPNGRTRVEEIYTPMESTTAALGQININYQQTQPREADRKGKQREVPTRQPKGPPAWGYDGAVDNGANGKWSVYHAEGQPASGLNPAVDANENVAWPPPQQNRPSAAGFDGAVDYGRTAESVGWDAEFPRNGHDLEQENAIPDSLWFDPEEEAMIQAENAALRAGDEYW